MPTKLNRAAELAGETIGSIEGATLGARSAIEQRTKPVRTTMVRKAEEAKRVGERRVTGATNKAAGARKAAKRRVESATKKAIGARQPAGRRTSAAKKTTGPKRTSRPTASSTRRPGASSTRKPASSTRGTATTATKKAGARKRTGTAKRATRR